MSLTVFITGATSGIGKATAEFLAQHNYRLILCGRKEDQLKDCLLYTSDAADE